MATVADPVSLFAIANDSGDRACSLRNLAEMGMSSAVLLTVRQIGVK